MDRIDIAATILQRAYDAYRYDTDSIDLNAVRTELGADDSQFWNVVDEMAQQDLVRPFTTGGSSMVGRRGYIIGGLGILMEKDRTAPPSPRSYSNFEPLLTPAKVEQQARPSPQGYSNIEHLLTPARAGRIAWPSHEPRATRTHKGSPLLIAALGALISSFVVVLAWATAAQAPLGSRLDATLLWLGIWAIDFLLTLPFARFTAMMWRTADMHPVSEVLGVALVSLVLAAILALVLFYFLSPHHTTHYINP